MWFFSLSRKNKLIMLRDLFNILSLGHSQVCNHRWWTVGIWEVWHHSQFQGKDTLEVGVVEAEVGFLKVVNRTHITAQLLQWSKCHLVLHLKCNIMPSQDILHLKMLSNNKWWTLKVELKHRLLAMRTSKLSNASFSIKVNFWFINFWHLGKNCPYKDRCSFAHGETELRQQALAQ